MQYVTIYILYLSLDISALNPITVDKLPLIQLRHVKHVLLLYGFECRREVVLQCLRVDTRTPK